MGNEWLKFTCSSDVMECRRFDSGTKWWWWKREKRSQFMIINGFYRVWECSQKRLRFFFCGQLLPVSFLCFWKGLENIALCQMYASIKSVILVIQIIFVHEEGQEITNYSSTTSDFDYNRTDSCVSNAFNCFIEMATTWYGDVDIDSWS